MQAQHKEEARKGTQTDRQTDRERRRGAELGGDMQRQPDLTCCSRIRQWLEGRETEAQSCQRQGMRMRRRLKGREAEAMRR